MTTYIAFALALYFALTLGIAGASKLRDMTYFRALLTKHSLIPQTMLVAATFTIPCGEVLLSLLLIIGWTAYSVAIVNALLFAIFFVYKLVLYWRTPNVDCGCYSPRQLPIKTDRLAEWTTSSILLGLALVYLYVAPLHPSTGSVLTWAALAVWVVFGAVMMIQSNRGSSVHGGDKITR